MRNKDYLISWPSFPYLKTADQLDAYLAERPKGHKYYYHYTSLGAINGILENGFCISCVDRFNDSVEKSVFSDHAKKYYSLCFSTGEQENLALWYLYSGVGGNGGRMQFTYNSVEKLLKSTCRLVEYNYVKHKTLREIAVLNEDNAILRFEEVVYADRSKKNRGMDLKYNTMTNHGNVSEAEWKTFVSRHRGFQKRQIWYHEKETRLLIELTDDLYSKLDPNKTYAVILEIPPAVMRYVKIRFAPNIPSLDDADITEQPNIAALRSQPNKLQLSEHAGMVEINPCRNCTKHKSK